MVDDDIWTTQRRVLGEYIRSQRRLAKLSLRDLAALTSVSNPYLSQIERGLHEPSLRVLKAIADALDLSTEVLLSRAGLHGASNASGEGGNDEASSFSAPSSASEASSSSSSSAASVDGRAVVNAIRLDPALTEAQKTALLAVYHSYREANE